MVHAGASHAGTQEGTKLTRSTQELVTSPGKDLNKGVYTDMVLQEGKGRWGTQLNGSLGRGECSTGENITLWGSAPVTGWRGHHHSLFLPPLMSQTKVVSGGCGQERKPHSASQDSSWQPAGKMGPFSAQTALRWPSSTSYHQCSAFGFVWMLSHVDFHLTALLGVLWLPAEEWVTLSTQRQSSHPKRKVIPHQFLFPFFHIFPFLLCLLVWILYFSPKICTSCLETRSIPCMGETDRGHRW